MYWSTPTKHSLVVKLLRSPLNRVSRRTYMCAFFLFCALIQVSIVGSKFGKNDDVGISQIANGGFSGKPSEHVVFVNALLGFVLKWLYTVTQTVQWYPVLIICSLVFSISVFFDILIRYFEEYNQFNRASVLFISLLITLPMFAYRVFEINFTGTAYFCSTLGFASWILSLKNSNSDHAIGPLVSCLLGFLWRDHAFFSVIPIWFIVLLVCFRRSYQIKFSKNLALFGMMLGFGKIVDFISKNSSLNWKAFYELNSLRGMIHENTIIDSLIKNQGMTFVSRISSIPEINLDFFFNWFFSYSVMGEESLRKITDIIEINSNFASLRIGDTAFIEARGSLLIFFALFLFALIIKPTFRWKFFFASLFIIGFHLLIISYLERFIRTPKYVIDGIQFSVTVAALILFFSQLSVLEYSRKNRNPYRVASFGALCLLLILGSVRLFNDIANAYSDNRINQLKFESSAKRFGDQLREPAIAFVLPFEISDLSPWSSFRLSSLPVVVLGWTMSSPLEQSRLAFMGVEDDLNYAILNGELSILSSIGSNTPFQVQRYLMTNFDACLNVQSKVLDSTNFSLTRFAESTDCENGVYTSAPLTDEVFLTEPNFSVFITNCGKFVQNKTIELDLHSPFGEFAEPFRIEISYIGPNLAHTKFLYTIKPGGTNSLNIDTSGCEIDIRSISNGVIPKLLDKKSTDARTLYFGISRVAITSK